MKQEIKPRHLGIALAVLAAVLVVLMGWRVVNRPKMAKIDWKTPGAVPDVVPANVGSAKAQFAQELMRRQRGESDSQGSPGSQGGQ